MASLVEILVKPSQLLLDPNNARLFDRPIKRVELDSSQIEADDIQKKVMAELAKSKHGLDQLMFSIESQGFINLDTLLVKPLDGTSKYIVLEGNRRTAAIKSLLSQDNIEDAVKQSLRNVAVKELRLSKGEDEEEEVQKIVSMRHLSGPKEWSPIARASAIYKNYMVQHRKLIGGPMTMMSDRVLTRTSQVIGMQKPQLRLAMGVFALYQELAEAGFDVRGDHFSLLELLVKARRMASEYFGFNRSQLRTYDDGVEKINDFFIDRDRVVRNPADFRKIQRIFSKGMEGELELVRVGVREMDDILADIKGRERETTFLNTLASVRQKLERLPLSSFRETDREAVAIMSLKRLVDKRFVPIAEQHLGIDE